MINKFPVSWLAATIMLFGSLFFGWQGWRAYQATTIIVEWSTATELNTAGFNLYRSETLDGAAVQVNTHLISPAADPLTGADYIFEDPDVPAGKTYFYTLEELELSGGSTLHGPIITPAPHGGWIEGLASLVLLVSALLMFWTARSPKGPAEA